nr:C435 [uncultured bacterium]
MHPVAIDHHLGRSRPGVVVAAHGKAVGAGVAQRQQIALGQRQRACVGQEIAALAHRPDQLPNLGLAAGLAQRQHRVMRVVEGRTQQVVHGRIDDGEIALRAGFQIFDPCQQHTGRADDGAPWFDRDFHPAAGKRCTDGGCVIGRARNGLVAIGDAESPAKVHVVEGDAFGQQRLAQRRDTPGGLAQRGEVGQLRADVAGNPMHAQAGQAGGASVQRWRVLGRNAELVFLQASRDVGVGAGVDVRIHAQRDRCLHAQIERHLIQPFQLGGGFHVEAANAGRKRLAQLRGALADAGEHHPVGLAPGAQHARQLAARHHVESGAQARQHVQHGEVGIGLDGVADPVRLVAKRGVVGAVGSLDGGPRIDVTGRAETLRHGLQRDALQVQRAVAVLQGAHGAGWSGGVDSAAGGAAGASGGGMYSGPVWPQPDNSSRPAAANARPGRRNMRYTGGSFRQDAAERSGAGEMLPKGFGRQTLCC